MKAGETAAAVPGKDNGRTSAAAGELLSGGGEMGARIRAFDWSRTPLGPIVSWPQSLVTAVRIMLCSRYPMFLWWEGDLIKFYNDAYIPVLGKKHPAALGMPAREVWHEIWNTLGPQTRQVMESEEATWNDRVLLEMERSGYKEETYFTWSYSPAFNDAGLVSGVFCACSEETERVLSERRLRALRRLSAETQEARTVEQVCLRAAEALSGSAHDLPFALIYLLSADGKVAHLAGRTGLRDDAVAPTAVSVESFDPWPCAQALAGQTITLRALEPRGLPGGPWPEPVGTAAVLPFRAGKDSPAGFIVLGASARRAFDDNYLSFFHLIAEGLSSAAARAYGQEQERCRAEALAQIDQAKTAFFSNVSHEFRTPLTLMLGPLEDLLGEKDRLQPEDRERLDTAHRNSLRLLKLVNTLLDFSRIEAGRVEATYEPTDLAALTAELASVFRSALERAGLKLVIDTPPLAEPVYVDREMWEKIVLNLLSNAFKFTFEGEVGVSLRAAGRTVELIVSDTGVGIPAEEIAHIFERFHRVQGTRGRSFEGSGIGLALVQELVRLHGGSVRSESSEGRGSRFIVVLPLGNTHLPQERIGASRSRQSTAARSETFIEEALRMLPQGPGFDAGAANDPPHSTVGHEVRDYVGPSSAAGRPRIVVADDNADMRAYAARLLGPSYDVTAVTDGAAALDAIRTNLPDLVLTDIMMPRLDGFGLLQALRTDPEPRLRQLPVILLSARAGEEARIAGLESGADDYLTKPFSARELLARIEGSLKLEAVRREARAELDRAAVKTLRLAESLQLSNEDLRRANEDLEQFAYSASHDLQEPLRGIKIYSELLAKRYGQKLEGEGCDLLRFLGTGASRMECLLRDLLAYTQVTKKLGADGEEESADAGEVLKTALLNLSGAMTESGASITAEPLPLVQIHSIHLQQLFQNLVGNAIKYRRPDRKPEVRIAAERRNEHWLFSVSDNGIGIEPQYKERIFGLFKRLHTGDEYSGTGIGLAICQRIVERYHGRIWVESEPEKGSTFFFSLPA